MNLKYILVSILIVGMLSACTSDMTPEMMQERIIQANTNLQSYSTDMTMKMDMSTSVQGKPMVITADTTQSGSIDRKNKKLFMKGSTKTSFSGMKLDMATETYIVDDFVYVKVMDNWMKMQIQNELWNQQDHIKQTTGLLETGTIDVLPEEEMDGMSYYVFAIQPDMKKVVEIALKSQEQSEVLDEHIDFADMVRKYTATIYVNKKTFVIERQKIDMRLVMTAENMGKNMINSSDITMDTVIDAKMYDINKKVTITLPEEALGAQDYSKVKGYSGSNSITGNVISDTFN
ncbi:MAG: DUF6612 family protein [Nanoarchaeota archaeon]